MKTTIILWGLLTLILSVPAQAYEEHREFRMGAAGIEILKITCDAGDLFVTGNPGTTDILVKADIEIAAKNNEKAARFAREQIELQFLKNGREAHLKSLIGKKDRYIRSAVVDLRVEVPAQIHLDITDGSGSVVLHDLQGNLHLVDGSGSIEIENLRGNVNIDDGSGAIDIRQVQGELNVMDGSGGIRIEHLDGNAVIEDGSGGILADTVGGNLEIRDGSGHIEIRRIEGNVRLSDGSGSIDIREVGGDVVVSRDSSGNRHISNVGGNITQTQ